MTPEQLKEIEGKMKIDEIIFTGCLVAGAFFCGFLVGEVSPECPKVADMKPISSTASLNESTCTYVHVRGLATRRVRL